MCEVCVCLYEVAICSVCAHTYKAVCIYKMQVVPKDCIIPHYKAYN